MDEKIRVLLVEDSTEVIALLTDHLQNEEFHFSSKKVKSKKEFENELIKFRADVVVFNHISSALSSSEALKIFRNFKENHNNIASFIILTDTASEELAYRTLREGADDYIFKDRLKRFPYAVLNAYNRNRLQVEKQREEEENLHLRDILQSSLHEIYVFDPESFFIEYANQEAQRNLGFSLMELLNMTPADFIEDFEEKRLKAILSTVEKSKKGRIYERYAIRKNGTRYPMQAHLQIIQQGRRKKVLVNVLDVSEMKEHKLQKELALFIQNCLNARRSLEDSLKLILEDLCNRKSIPAAEFWAKDFEESEPKLYAQKKYTDHPAPKTGNLFAKRVFETGKLVKNQELIEKSPKIKNEEIREEGFLGAEAYPIKSGSEVIAAIVVYFLADNKNKDPLIILKEGVQDKLASSIKRKKTEEELQKIFKFSPDLLAILGKDGYIKKINPSCKKILGYTQEEMLTMPFEELLHPDDYNKLIHWKGEHLKENEVSNYEVRWITSSGEYRWFSWSVTPFLKEELNFAIGKDITEFKNQVEAIRKQNKKLSEIAWEQSHTVRAPLTRLMACVHYLEDNDDNPETILSSIKASAHELDNIVKGIVDRTENISRDGEF